MKEKITTIVEAIPEANCQIKVTTETLYPECEKLAAVSEKSQICGEFLDWLRSEKEVELVFYGSNEYVPMPFRYDIEHLLAEYFGIDLIKVEKEKRAMLDSLRRKDKNASNQ